MILECVCVGSLEVNCYILAEAEGKEAIIIDPGSDCQRIKQALSRHRLRPALVINTHGHVDHIGCDDEFGLPLYIHADDVGLLRSEEKNLSNFVSTGFTVKSAVKELKEGDYIELNKIKLLVIHTPGHTPGGISLLLESPENNKLFSGDTLFCHSVGRTDFPGASHEALIKSIKDKLLILPNDTIVYPGHGPTTTIAAEKKNNPFL